MYFYTTRHISMLCLVLTLGIYVFLEYSLPNISLLESHPENIASEIISQKPEERKIQEEKKSLTNQSKQATSPKKRQWSLVIPKIGLEAPIAEGTTQEVMEKFVGHFEETPLWDGNICLAAHNRGYRMNYFQNIKELKKGDEVIYITKEGTKVYQVILMAIIRDTDWSYLRQTKENRLTLITCVEDKPEYRRCIQAIEIKEEKNEKTN